MRSYLRATAIRTVTSLRLHEVMLSHLRRRVAQGNPLVLVVEAHETLHCDAARLRRQLDWVAERFTLISPQTFFGLWDRTKPSPSWHKPPILFTFDDGRESNYTVAAPILESMGARGLFFVVPEFIGLAAQKARDFYYSKIDIRGLAHQPDERSQERWMPMNPEQLADLARRGHWIGNHTLSHANLTGLSPANLELQIATSAEKISSWTQKSPEAFSWPYSWDAITPEAWNLIRKTHPFCFSPCAGITDCSQDSPHLIWRTEIEAYYSDSEYRFMYSGLVDPIWSGKRRRLRRILTAT